MKHLLPILYLIVFSFGLQASGQSSSAIQGDYPAKSKPNFIIIFTDDQGYNDLGCFGSETIKTPHLDRMAKEGRKLTSFYSASPICTPARAALLTGSYPKRIEMANALVFPGDNYGLHPDEVTIADMLKEAGYATACIGKWHLGHRKPFLPTNQGFDSYYGIPYSNDMNHPDNSGMGGVPRRDASWKDQETAWKAWKTPLMQDEAIIELPVNQRTITRRYTDKAIEFITENQGKPFFLYLPHSMPHVPLFVPEDAYDPDPENAYKATIEHMDAETGRLMEAVRELGLSENTYLIYTSDNGSWNGSWLPFHNHAGSAYPLRDGKGSTYEGGLRVPFIVWGPGRIPAGTESDAIATTMDLLPTIARLSGADLKPRGPIDGLDMSALLHGKGVSPRNEFLYYNAGDGHLHGLRQGDWKLRIAKKNITELYHLAEDIGESTNLADKYPERVKTLNSRMKELNKAITADIRPRGEF